jgi:hypothetical protein
MQPGRFTELFFLDEATAFAAGHRPCALCRRQDYKRFVELWRGLHPGPVGADRIDAQLHRERVDPRTRARRPRAAPPDDLPDGTFVLRNDEPALVLGGRLLHWTPAGYTEAAAGPVGGTAQVITPPSLVEILRTGWRGDVPFLHPSAGLEPAAQRNP